MDFEIVGEITEVEVIAVNRKIEFFTNSQSVMAKVAGASSKASGMLNSIGTKRTASGAGASRSRHTSTSHGGRARFVVCVDSGSNDDLQARRIYRTIPDLSAARSKYIRVVDDSGEDYLYPERLFLPVQLSLAAQEALSELSAAGV